MTKLVGYLIAVVSLTLLSCRTAPTGNQPHLDIVKTVAPSRFSVLISNSTPQTIGIWHGDNSWAWYMLTVYLRERPRGQRIRHPTEGPRLDEQFSGSYFS